VSHLWPCGRVWEPSLAGVGSGVVQIQSFGPKAQGLAYRAQLLAYSAQGIVLYKGLFVQHRCLFVWHRGRFIQHARSYSIRGLLKQRKACLYSTGAHPQKTKISAKSDPGEFCRHGPWHPSWAPPESSKSCAWGVYPWCVAPLALQAALGAQPGGGKPCGGCA
jgi:hypothetical protein